MKATITRREILPNTGLPIPYSDTVFQCDPKRIPTILDIEKAVVRSLDTYKGKLVQLSVKWPDGTEQAEYIDCRRI